MSRSAIALAAAMLALAGCGRQQLLRPRAGEPLPTKPATSPPPPPTADRLLAFQPRYRPGRSDELLIRSQTRPDDRFDKPPQ